MTITAQARLVGQQQVEITWASTDPDPVAGFDVSVDINTAGFIGLGIASGTARLWVDQSGLWGIGDTLVYRVTDLDTLLADITTLITVPDLEAEYTFGPVDPLADQIRYTTLDAVKQRLGITNVESDTALTTAIISAEIAIDQWNGRAFPDTGANPEIVGIPEAIREWSLDAAIAVWKAADAPFGQGGSEAWLGSLDVQNITERVLRRHPLSLGYKVSWGVA